MQNTSLCRRSAWPGSAFRFAISSTFTAEPLERVIAFWGTELGRHYEVEFAPYNQIVQTMYAPAGVFGRNQTGINVVLLRADDFGNTGEENAREVLRHIRGGDVLICECPPSPGVDGAFLSRLLEEESQVILRSAIDRLYPVRDWYSPHGERLGGIPYTDEFFAALGTMIVRRADEIFRAPLKVVVADCDNTLWHGICGEDGPQGVSIEPPRSAMQRILLKQREAGMLLAIASKNNETDVMETFALHTAMPLRLDHFAAKRINWDSKTANLRALAAELNLSLGSFIFLDDDPKECAEVEKLLPEVVTVCLPHEAEALPHFLEHVWAFDHSVITTADRQRAGSYSGVREFEQARETAGGLAEFIASLNLRVSIAPVDASRLARAAQLTVRTNQFNATGIRRSENDIKDLIKAGAQCWSVDVADRFGDYGQTGLIIFSASFEVETFLLSCRVLGRGVEHELLRRLGAEALSRGVSTVTIHYSPTARNHMVKEFLMQTCGCGQPPFVHDAAGMATVETGPLPGGRGSVPAVALSGAARPDYAHIARTFSRADQILGAIRRPVALAETEGWTELDRTLAGIWTELLAVPSIRRDDNFFDLGGHSLLVVLLQLRVREAFGVELDVDDIYSGTLTLEALAHKIELARAGGMSSEEYERLVEEIGELSEEQVREMLAREEARA